MNIAFWEIKVNSLESVHFGAGRVRKVAGWADRSEAYAQQTLRTHSASRAFADLRLLRYGRTL
jgi:hypothetical protein